MTPERWQRLMTSLNAPASRDVFADLVAAYSEPHRHYHTAAHIQDCLARLDEAASLTAVPEEIELALWFHDAIYKPASSTNELESAQWARAFLEAVGAPEDRRARVFAHIMATKHEAPPPDEDARFVVDIDLSILGREPNEYDRFEQNVRKEYKWVPWPIYRRRRSEILESFLSRPAIYSTEHFRSRYEEQARENLKSAIQRLRK
jgi:predicted metal-dependent HD superfamily phosphohydrolase